MKAEFDQFAQTYRKQHDKNISITGHTTEYFAAYKAKKLFQWVSQLQTIKTKHILDFGCGDGIMTEQVRSLFPKSSLSGVDPSKKSIEIAQKNYPSINFQVSTDNLKMFKTNSFDIIFTATVFHHIPFDEHQHYIDQLTRILKPKGLLVIFEHNPLNPLTRYLFNTCPFDVDATMLTHWYAHTLVKAYGKVTTKFYGFFPRALHIFQPLEHYLESIPLGAQYAIILKKT
jgi:trans-aconitate methyltransferase